MAPSVTERRNDLARRLARSLTGDFVVVASPDHPLVMRSVDLLIGGRSGITALMMSTVEERRRPELFTARLSLNMMALPPHTNFVRLLVHDDEPSSSDGTFAAELELDARATQPTLIRLASAPPRSRQLDRAEKAQRLAEERFADTYRLAKVLRRGFEADKGPSRGRRVSRKPSHDRIGNQVQAAFFSAMPTLATVNTLTLEQASLWYDIVDGEVEPRKGTGNALFVPDYPEIRGDPDKAIRAAAFAGLVMAPTRSARSLDDVGNLIERYARLK